MRGGLVPHVSNPASVFIGDFMKDKLKATECSLCKSNILREEPKKQNFRLGRVIARFFLKKLIWNFLMVHIPGFFGWLSNQIQWIMELFD